MLYNIKINQASCCDGREQVLLIQLVIGTVKKKVKYQTVYEMERGRRKDYQSQDADYEIMLEVILQKQKSAGINKTLG